MKLKADGPSLLRIGFGPERMNLRPNEIEGIAYQMTRVHAVRHQQRASGSTLE